jgi:UDP-N-acetylmuramyl tripeptide synthase
MVDAGCIARFMEVSSHAVDQHRIAGLNFAGAIFTNITHDHLDYHLRSKTTYAPRKNSLMISTAIRLRWLTRTTNVAW